MPPKVKDTVTIQDSKDQKLYQKLSHLEHVLKRPSTYIGSIEKTQEDAFVLDKSDPDDTKVKIVRKPIEFIPGLYKLVDELIVNMTDHWSRLAAKKSEGDSTIFPVSTIKVDVDKETGMISMYNDGDGIHIVKVDGHDMYAPELIFGHLLTGTNYDDTEEKIVGGQNGYGAKLANIFSKEFNIETVDKSRNLKYTQTFRNNMMEKTEPKITTYSSKPYTRISFIPDYARFGLTGLTDDMNLVIEKRVYDCAAWTDKAVAVYLNGTKIDVKCFERYADLYLGDKAEHPRVYLSINNRWDVVVSYNESSNFEQVSFVNGINTIRGGKHVEYIVGQIRDGLVEYIKKKKKVQVKPATIRNELYVFVKAVIANPVFDSQTKETLTSPVSKFGSSATIDDKMIDKIAKTGIMERIMSSLESKNTKDFQKTDGKKQNTIRGLPKLYDAIKAGTKDSFKCTLILTEGDSAKTSVISGLGQDKRDFYGVFPLRGKPLNVKDTDQEKINNNAEISAVKKIIGLKTGVDYSLDISREDLRYGKIMILCDSDVDGSHIKGLLMNMFHSFWTSLLKTGFIISMLTPIIKVSKGANHRSFYNLSDYKTWKDTTPDSHTYTIKYYKGLGTSSANEFKDYFRELKMVNYVWTDESDNSLDMAFNKKRADDRKKWLEGYDVSDTLDYTKTDVKIDDFINKELIHFSYYDNTRSIANMCDGLKPSQRKILFAAFKRRLTSEIKVAQFAGYVSEHAAYHHGEVSMQSTIVSMAQNYVGANNVSLLVPSGAFGSRIMGGQDAASARYIFTNLSPITKFIYREEDFPVMSYLDDDGFSIEPNFYMPIIPMVLVNGTRGIGTGYSSDVPPHHPKDIIQQIRNKLDGKHFTEIKPWYCGFKGSVVGTIEAGYVNKGVFRIVDDTTVEITELPIGTWTEKYKQFLEEHIIDKANPNKKQFIKSYTEQCSDTVIYFNVKLTSDKMDELRYTPDELEKAFKLVDSSNSSTTNMYLYDNSIKMYKYASPYDIINDFFAIRLEYYQKRKDYQIGALVNELNILKEKYRFIHDIVVGDIDLRGQTKASVESILESRQFAKLATTVGKETSYDYLVQMPIYSMTQDKLEELKAKLDKKQAEYDLLMSRSIDSIWRDELDELSAECDKYYAEYNANLAGTPLTLKSSSGAGKAKKK